MNRDQFIKINRSKSHIQGRLNLIGFKEGDYEIVYAPALRISAYGDSIKEAQQMLEVSIEAFAKELFKLPEHKVYEEFRKLGWEPEKFFKKRLRNLSPTTFEDIKKEFNIPDNTPIRESSMAV